MQDTQFPSLGREDSPGGGHGNSLQYSCLENPMDREAWRATIQGVRIRDFESRLTRLSTHGHTSLFLFTNKAAEA